MKFYNVKRVNNGKWSPGIVLTETNLTDYIVKHSAPNSTFHVNFVGDDTDEPEEEAPAAEPAQ